jgi:hypothetical protein
MLLMAVGAMMIEAKYWVSVNLDVRCVNYGFFANISIGGYKIIFFHLMYSNDPVYRDPTDPNRISDELFRLNFRQRVLANMRGDGEHIWERDFSLDLDMLKEIYEGPVPVEPFELELSYTYVDFKCRNSRTLTRI